MSAFSFSSITVQLHLFSILTESFLETGILRGTFYSLESKPVP